MNEAKLERCSPSSEQRCRRFAQWATTALGILLSGPDAFATNLELSIRAELSSPVPQGVVIPPRGVDFISGAVAPEININVTKSGLVIESGTARAPVEHDARGELPHI